VIDHKNYCSVLLTGNCNCQHVSLPFPSDTFDGPLDHNDQDTYECPRCIAERAVFAASKAETLDDKQMEAVLGVIHNVEYGEMYEPLREFLITHIEFLRGQYPQVAKVLDEMEGKY
jgi:hypothetical protein